MMNIPTTFWAVDRILQGLDAEAWAVDGMAPQAVLFPESVEEVVDVVRSASAAGLAIVPANRTSGARTGNRPRRCNLIVSLTRMNRVLEYEPADLTARVEAGCSLSDFHSETRRHGQWLPLDPPEAATATIGGLAATDDPGPLR
ncbi:MAG: FAD-binding oxidoreductase, partial [Acidobacteria bacterium]|nr:FAD-binding oxidoreductase [Acidobacteriota bacterium]